LPPDSAHAPAFAAATQPSYARTLFLGPEACAQVGTPVYVLMSYLLQRLAGGFADALNLGSLRTMMLEEFGSFVAAVVPAVVLSKIERRSWTCTDCRCRGIRRAVLDRIRMGFAGISLLVGGCMACMFRLRPHRPARGENRKVCRVLGAMFFWSGCLKSSCCADTPSSR